MSYDTSHLESLFKALEAGSYNAAPGTLEQGSALQIEELSPVMHNVTYTDKHIILQKMIEVRPVKSTLMQFDRQLSYGRFGGSAQLEGAVGQEKTSDYIRATVPMAYYSHIRRVTVASNMVATVDGQKSEDRAASDAALELAGDIEFDLFRGKADFSNAGVFDGNPLALPPIMANMLGLDVQIRSSDNFTNTQDLMFNSYGSSLSVVIQCGSSNAFFQSPQGSNVLCQSNLEDAAVRSVMNMGNADLLLVDPLVLAAYNKMAFGKERIFLAGSPQENSSADLRRQWVSGGVVQLQASRFLSGRTAPDPTVVGAPNAPTIAAGSQGSSAGTAFLINQVYIYYVTAVNEIGESVASANLSQTVSAAGNSLLVTITPSGSGNTARFFRVFRTQAGAAASTARFIGNVANSGASTTTFTDLGNKIPGFVTGFLVQGECQGIGELAPYSRLKLAVGDLSLPEAHFRFLTVAVWQPRKEVILDNCAGAL